MAWKLMIDGVDQTQQIESLRQTIIRRSLNERSSMVFSCKPGLVPDRFTEVEAYAQDGVTLVFGGVIINRKSDAVQYGSAPFYTDVTCSDYFTYFDWSWIDLEYTVDVSLEDVIDDLLAQLPAAYGITKDPAQLTGPMLTPFAWVGKRASDCVRELFQRTGYVARLSPAKAFRMLLPGTEAAPLALSDAAPSFREVAWADSDRTPANKVTCVCGPNGVGDTIVNQWISDGVATVFALEDVNVPASDVWPGVVNIGGTVVGGVISGGTNYPLHAAGAGGANDIEFDPDTDDGTLTFKGTSSALIPNTTTINLQYAPLYPFTVRATSGATPVIEERFAYPDVKEYARGQEIADELLVQRDQQPRKLNCYESRDGGWEPGQAMLVGLTDRGISSTFLIGTASIILHTDLYWTYDVEATENDTYQGSHLDQWREMTGSGGSTATTVSGSGGTTTTSTVLSSPAFLGGSDRTFVAKNPAAWVRVPNALPFIATANFTARLRAMLCARNAGIGVKARIYDDTAAAPVASMETSLVTATTPTEATAVGALISGHRYFLEMQGNTNDEGVAVVGQMESV